MFEIDTSLNEGYNNSTGFWIKDNIVYPIYSKHIRAILDNPGLFGFEKEYLLELFRKYHEKIGFEGKARKEIIIEAIISRGWIRARYHTGKHQYLTISVSKELYDEKEINKLEKSLKALFSIPKDVKSNVEWIVQ